MKTVLVTGAGGLLGRSLVSLLARDHRVVAVSRQAGAHDDSNVEPFAADLSQPVDPRGLPERLDAVVYLAQSPRFREFPAGAPDMRQVNTDQPLALLELARERGATAFVYASSGSVYAPGPRPIQEDDPAPADGFYPASKRAAELMLAPYGALMNVALLRYFFIYGPGQNRRMLLPRLADMVRDGQTVTLQGEEGIRINPIHVDDAAAATAAALDLAGTNFVNVAGPEVHSIRNICELLGAAIGRSPRFEFDRTATPQHLVADTSRMERQLGRPTKRLADAVEDLL